MSDLVIDQFQAKHEAALSKIKIQATNELRAKYIPRVGMQSCNASEVAVLVALKDGSVVGTAEYFQKSRSLYIQGIAVHPDYREKGVCRSILLKAEEIACVRQLSSLSLSTIEETGNVAIFEKLGFSVVSRMAASNYVSLDGESVMLVNMKRRIT